MQQHKLSTPDFLPRIGPLVPAPKRIFCLPSRPHPPQPPHTRKHEHTTVFLLLNCKTGTFASAILHRFGSISIALLSLTNLSYLLCLPSPPLPPDSTMADDVRARKLQPIYNALDARNYKMAIKLCTKKDLERWDIVKTLKAHALERLGKVEEALEVCAEVAAHKPTDETVRK